MDRAAVGNVKMWNCGSVKVWKYENGLGLLSIACCDDACGEYSCQFNGFSDKGIQLAMFNLNSSVDFSRRDAEAQRMLDICVVLSFRPKQDGFANLHLVGEKH